MDLNHKDLNKRFAELRETLPQPEMLDTLLRDLVTACARIAHGYPYNIDDIEYYGDPRQWPEHISNRIRSLIKD